MNLTLLLTACVNPGNMPNNILTNVTERESQYINALKFYLDNTPFNVVFIENTLHDFSDRFDRYIKAGRLEYITFQGNNYNKKLGKGYGEGQIIKNGFDSSKLLTEAQNIMKITGRLQLSNIMRFSNKQGSENDTVYSDLVITDTEILSHSYIFIAPKQFFTEYFIPDVESINDSSNYYFEKYLYDKIVEWVKAGHRHSFFKYPLKVIGNGAADGHAYYLAKKFENVRTIIRYFRRKNFVKNLIKNDSNESRST